MTLVCFPTLHYPTHCYSTAYDRFRLLIPGTIIDCFLQIRPNGASSPIIPSFLALDTDGRVLRVDSFSKIVAPGSRLGFVTGHKVLVEKIMLTRESATVSGGGFGPVGERIGIGGRASRETKLWT